MPETPLVIHCKISREDYNSINVKNEDTLYAVNGNGDFSDANLDNHAELYLGNKKLSNDLFVTDTIDDTSASQNTAASPKAVKDYVNEMTSLGYAFMGVANTSTTPQATDRKMCYIAIQNGDYVKFGLTNVKKYSLMFWDGSQWNVQNTDVLTQEGSIVQELGYNHDKVMSQASVTVEVKNVLEKFAWKSINV